MAATVDSTTADFGGIGGGVCLKVQRLDLGTYATGGVALTAAIVGTGSLVTVLPFPDIGYIPEWDAANAKIKVMFADYSTTTDAALIEIATDTNLGSASFPALIVYRQ